MGLVRFKNQTEYAFLIWMGSFPESVHTCDNKRFYIFVKTVVRYRSTKWCDDGYFRQRILAHTPNFSVDLIERLWDKMQILIEFYISPPINTTAVRSGDYSCIQIGVKNGEIYKIDITRDQFLQGGVKY